MVQKEIAIFKNVGLIDALVAINEVIPLQLMH